jgi:hypothetical protein
VVLSPSVRSAINHQLLMREVNNRLIQLADGDLGEFLCECGGLACLEKILVPVAEYRWVRNDPDMFIIDSRHKSECLGWIVRRHERWSIVETAYPT